MLNFKHTVIATILGVAVLTGCSTWQRGDADRSAGRVVDDKQITAKIKGKLGDAPVYKFSDVTVNTFQGVVQLSGFVSTEDQKQRAGQIAEQTPGVARVVNSLVLKAQADETLTPTGREAADNRTYAPINRQTDTKQTDATDKAAPQ